MRRSRREVSEGADEEEEDGAVAVVVVVVVVVVRTAGVVGPAAVADIGVDRTFLGVAVVEEIGAVGIDLFAMADVDGDAVAAVAGGFGFGSAMREVGAGCSLAALPIGWRIGIFVRYFGRFFFVRGSFFSSLIQCAFSFLLDKEGAKAQDEIEI